jgi:hypothetical protein
MNVAPSTAASQPQQVQRAQAAPVRDADGDNDGDKAAPAAAALATSGSVGTQLHEVA